jgi:hypothetical protein
VSARSNRCPPPPLLAPRHCVVVDGQRWLHLGLFTTAKAAEMRFADYQAASPLLRQRTCTTEPVWVSRRVER